MNFLTDLLWKIYFASASAAESGPTPISIKAITFAPGTGLDSLQLGLGRIIQVIYYIAGASAIIYFVYSGILYITAAGNPDAAKKGQQGLLYATIGIVVVALSYYLVTFIAAWAAGGMPTPQT